MRLEPFCTLTFAPAARSKTAAGVASVRAGGGNPLAAPPSERYAAEPHVAALGATTAACEQWFGAGVADGPLSGSLQCSVRTERRSDGVAAVSINALIALDSGGNVTVVAHGREAPAGTVVILVEFGAPAGPLVLLNTASFIGHGHRDPATGAWTVELARCDFNGNGQP